jgi:hypothetical protein
MSKIIVFYFPENRDASLEVVLTVDNGERERKLEIFLFIKDSNNADNRCYQETNSPTETTFL